MVLKCVGEFYDGEVSFADPFVYYRKKQQEMAKVYIRCVRLVNGADVILSNASNIVSAS